VSTVPHVSPTAVAAAAAAARVIAQAMQKADRDPTGFRFVAAGGRSPAPLYAGLAGAELNWADVEIFFGDERVVPPDHPDSNFGLLQRELVARLRGAPPRVHRIEAERGADDAASRYQVLLTTLPARSGPLFDLVLLGMGEDGHTASLYPGTAALHEQQRLCVANVVPALGSERLTLTFPALLDTAQVVVLATGGRKRAALQAVFGDGSACELPVARLMRGRAPVHWFVDLAAWDR
jgi:6-phosphogluconolactonase